MIVLRKPKKVGHTDWRLAEGAGDSTAKTHISGRLLSPSHHRSEDGRLRPGNVMCFLVKDWGAVERTWALELDTPGSITHLPLDLRQVLSVL